MGKDTAIQWADSSQNFWVGCKKVSQGCKNCYAETLSKMWGWDFKTVRRTLPPTFNAPLKWKEPKVVFTCSLSDFFIKEADGWRNDAWDIIRQCKQHTWLLLTKRPERVLDNLPADWGNGWEHVALGTSVENQEAADERIPVLAALPFKMRFLSAEPLLGPIAPELDEYFSLAYPSPIDWVIVGGESDPEYRPIKAEWVRNIRDRCNAHGVSFFFKQWDGANQTVIKRKGRYLDGREWNELPEFITRRHPHLLSVSLSDGREALVR